MDGERDVAAAFGFESLDQASTVGDDNRVMASFDQITTDFQCASFNASGVQFRQYLNDFHSLVWTIF